MKIVVYTIAKNEEKFVERWYKSMKEADELYVLDTGSTDNTPEIIENWCKNNNVPCSVTRSKWVNFSHSRTEALRNSEKAFPDADYLLLIDADMVLEDASRNGILSKERFSIMRDEIDKLLKNETVSEWFTKDWEILTERDIITPEGNVYRPDRVIFKGSKAIVIDYKTGKEKKEYKNQITNYAKLIESLGYTEVEKYILYLNQSENKTVKVD